MSKIFSDGFGDFPDVKYADADGILCIGGSLASDRLIHAYKSGIFPWYNEGEPITWFAPENRMVLFPENFKASKSFQSFIRKNNYKVTVNEAFETVINLCGSYRRKNQPGGTWITDEMMGAYIELHRLGYAHSYEVWDADIFVGGLYGIKLGSIFCGESMVSLQPNSSKLALYHLCTFGEFKMIDCQVYTAHLASLGAILIDRKAFMELLNSYSE